MTAIVIGVFALVLLNYIRVTGKLVKKVREQQEVIDHLDARNRELRDKILRVQMAKLKMDSLDTVGTVILTEAEDE